MLGKLLKYDMKAVFKYWWLAALTTVLLSVIAGVLLSYVIEEDAARGVLEEAIAIVGLVLSFIGIFVLPLVTEVLIIVRLYKHFFTDEGYLTFTLPVKKHALLNSKLIMAMAFQLAAVVTVVMDVIIILFVGMLCDRIKGIDNFSSDYGEPLFGELSADAWGFGILYTAEAILIGLAYMFVLSMVIFLCLTIASVLTKKHKVLVAIGLFYGANAISSLFTQIAVYGTDLNGVFMIFDSVNNGVSELALKWSVAAQLLIPLGALAAVGAGMYALEYYLLDRKLDLQ